MGTTGGPLLPKAAIPTCQAMAGAVPGCRRGWHGSQLFIAMANLSQRLDIKASGRGGGSQDCPANRDNLKTNSAM